MDGHSLRAFPASATADGTASKKKTQTFVIENKETGERWEMSSTSSSPAPQFTMLPVRPQTQSLTVLDNRTGKTYEVPIEHDTVQASAFAKIGGLVVYDPAYQNTAVAKSAICYIDGDNGILRYRGYPIEELAEKSTFLEVAYLLIYGELPNVEESKHWNTEIMRHTFLHNNLSQLMKSFNYNAHPMGMFISVMAGMSTFHPEANPSLTSPDVFKNQQIRTLQIYRILGKAATVAANSYRHRIGRPYNNPQRDLSYTANFLYMLDNLGENEYKPNPVLAKALDVMFILHADHELNCSTAAFRHISSSQVDPYSAIAGAAAALYGPLHGGACEAVLRMLESIGDVKNVPTFLEQVKKRERLLMGFGHRIYKNYDPRAKIIKKTAYEVFAVCGHEPLIEIAIELEKHALADDYFVSRKLYPNVDFYSGLIYKAMGFPTDFFPVLFAIPRVAGWLAHWNESLETPAKIWRPRQVYVGEPKRSYIPMEYRSSTTSQLPAVHHSSSNRRTRTAEYKHKL